MNIVRIIDTYFVICKCCEALYRYNKLLNKWTMVNLRPVWKKKEDCYRYQIKIDNHTFDLPRVIYKVYNPDWDMKPTDIIDHVDRDTKNNSISNLKLVTLKQNSQNRIKKIKYNKLLKKYLFCYLDKNKNMKKKFFKNEYLLLLYANMVYTKPDYYFPSWDNY